MRSKDPFEELLHRYRGLLFTLCRRYGRRGLDVDDLLQDATVALWRAREKVLEETRSVGQAALVWKIARNAVVDTLRRSRHEQIALLDEPDRTIVKLQLEGYSYEEIGQQLGMTEKNVSVRLVRIKERLRKQFDKI